MQKSSSVALVALLFSASSGFGQGPIQFRSILSGANAAPRNNSAMQWSGGDFDLSPALLFDGRVTLIGAPRPTSVSLFRVANPSEVGVKLYDFFLESIVLPDLPAFPGSEGYRITRTLQGSELTDLQSGLWYVNVVTEGFPNGEIRGQLTAVPEPSTVAFILLGTCALLSKRRKP
jgi:hypothetical protein